MIYRFGAYSLDPERRELRCEDRIREIQPKVLDLLVYLIRERERVVSRRQLLDDLWGDAAVIEGVLSTAVHAARSALGDSAGRQWAIKTIARRGYRFVAEVEERGDPPQPVAPRPAPPARSGATEASAEPREDRQSDAFVGRFGPLSRLDRAAAAAAGGEGRLMVVTGEPGIGKTRLLDEFATRMQSQGMEVFAAWCYEGEGSPPYWPWTQVLRAAIAHGSPEDALLDMGAGAADLVALLPALHDLRPDLPEPPRLLSGPARFRLFESIVTFLANRAKRGPLLITLDDLHWADHASLRLVGFFAREVKHSRILVATTLREGENADDSVLRETLAEIARHAPGERLPLAGLSEAETAQLIGSLSRRTPADSFVSAVTARSEGNPFFIKEIVNLLELQRVAGGEFEPEAESASVPPGVRDVILRRLQRRSEACRRVLSVAAIFGREFHCGVLENLLGTADRALSKPLEEARAAGFLRQQPARQGYYRFAHGLVQETLYAEWSAGERADWHRRAGQALEAFGASPLEIAPEDLAHHYRQAGAGGDPEKAIEYSVRAAEKAMTMHAHDEAARHYERALAALDWLGAADDARRGELLIALGTAQLDANRSDARGRLSLLEAARIARGLECPEMLARVATQLAGVAHYSGPGDLTVIELLEEALAGLDESEAELRARLMSDLAIQRLSPTTLAKGVSLSGEAVTLARKGADSDLLGRTLNIQCALLSAPEQIHDRLCQADALVELAGGEGDAALELSGHRWRLSCMLELGEVEAAERELHACELLAGEARDREARWYTLTMHGARAFFSGQLELAERCILGAYVQAHHEPNPFNVYTSDTQLRWLRKEQGRLGELADAADGAGTRFVALSAFRATRALMDVEKGSLERAREELELYANGGLADLPRDFTYLYSLAVLGELCVAVGDERAASLLYEALEPHARRYVVRLMGALCLGSVSRHLGQLATALGRWERAEEHFAVAAEDNLRLRAPLWSAYTQLDRARMILARGGETAHERAREQLAPCLAAAEQLGLRSLAAKARSLAERSAG